MNKPLAIELLVSEGCPARQRTREMVENILAADGVEAVVTETVVRTKDEAQRLHFLGSPTIRINGVDIEPEAALRTDYASG